LKSANLSNLWMPQSVVTSWRFRRILKNSFLPRLFKKAQMPGGVTHPLDGYPGRGTHRRWVQAYTGYAADGPFSAAC